MRVLLLCAAAFAGGILAGAVLWPSSAPAARRSGSAPRDAASLDLGEGQRAGPAGSGTAESGQPGSAADATGVATSLRDLAAGAQEELGKALAGSGGKALFEGNGTVTGFVRDPSGEPVRDVVVTASPQAQPFDLAVAARRTRERAHEDVDVGVIASAAIEGELWRRQVRHSARTDSEGRYEIKGLVPAWHRITAFHEDYDLQPEPRNNYVQPDAVLDFRAQPVAAVPVEVRMPDGERAENAWVTWQGPLGNGSDAWLPDPGTARLPRGTCRVRAEVWFPEPLQSQETEYDAGVAASGPLVLKLEGRRMLAARLVPAEGLLVPDRVEFRLRRVEGRAVDPESLKDDQGRAASQTGGRAIWYDLDPGRYLIAAFLGGRNLLAHAVAEVTDVSTEVELPFEAPAAGTSVAARLLGPNGEVAQGTTRFALVLGSGPGAREQQADALRCSDGQWLVLLPETTEGEALLRASVKDYGTGQESFDPRRAGTVTIRFREPARLKLRVDRFAGSGAEGRLFAALWCEAGTVSARQVEADGRCDLGSVQPQDYSLILFLKDREARWSISTRRITLRAGEQEEKVAVPALHTLVVRPSPKLRAREVMLLSSDPALGWMRRTARVENEVATFDALAAGQYEVQCGKRRVEVRVPNPGEFAVE
ncbi:MAG TPA: carboxypeptidase-like regulatory domain-containing protein [Planctomycetota bacterium]|nr:carboxypeptidase-like regulatory domain-containing protein [Planctomycetota bacterium]